MSLYNNIVSTDNYLDVLAHLNSNTSNLATLCRDEQMGAVVNQVKYNSTAGQLEYWTGTGWGWLDIFGGGMRVYSDQVLMSRQLQCPSMYCTTNYVGSYGYVFVGSPGGPRTIFLVGQLGFSNGFTVDYTGTKMLYRMSSGSLVVGDGASDNEFAFQVYGNISLNNMYVQNSDSAPLSNSRRNQANWAYHGQIFGSNDATFPGIALGGSLRANHGIISFHNFYNDERLEASLGVKIYACGDDAVPANRGMHLDIANRAGHMFRFSSAGNVVIDGADDGVNKLQVAGSVRSTGVNINGSAAEGGQITLGYKNNTQVTGQAASTWNIDVDTNNSFRIFRQNSASAVAVPIAINEAANEILLNTGNGGRVETDGSVKATSFKISALNEAPASATAAGTLGEIRITSGYIYVCVATNTWVRSALTSW